MSASSAGDARNTTRKKPSCGSGGESRAVHAQHAGRAQQPEHVILVGRAGRQLHLRHRVKRRRAAPRTLMPWIALSRVVRDRRALRSASRNACWCDRSPVSAATTAYCIGPGLHSRPSASFLIAASTSSSRGVAPTASQPVRQPGAR